MHERKHMFAAAFRKWLPFAVTILVVCGLVYAAEQQNYRQNANDPQIQIARDVTTAISTGQAAPDTIVSPTPTQEIDQSLSPFLEIFDATTTPIGSSVGIDGKMPTLPSGVFDSAKMHGEERFTWQPKNGIRIAAVVRYVKTPVEAYVLAGRDIREVEVREKNLAIMSGVAAALGLILSYLAILAGMMMHMKKHDHEHGHEQPPHPPEAPKM